MAVIPYSLGPYCAQQYQLDRRGSANRIDALPVRERISIIWPFNDLQMFGYEAIHINPTWSYQMHSGKGYESSPQTHCDCMGLAG